MKMSFFKYSLVFLLSFSLATSFGQNKPAGKASVEQQAISDRQFTFTPQSASPMGGRLILLNYPYSFKITGDSIDCYLPYFGRAFTAPYNASQGPLTFTSTDFTFNVTKADGKKQEITIETKDRQYNNKFYFTIYTNGTAQLQVTSTDRQPIIYQGEVTGRQAMK